MDRFIRNRQLQSLGDVTALGDEFINQTMMMWQAEITVQHELIVPITVDGWQFNGLPAYPPLCIPKLRPSPSTLKIHRVASVHSVHSPCPSVFSPVSAANSVSVVTFLR